VLRRLRISLLVCLLLFIAADEYLTTRRVGNWQHTLWVEVLPINADGSARVQHLVDHLEAEDFAAIENFLQTEAARYGVAPRPPFRVRRARSPGFELPRLSAEPTMLETLLWSLRMRWLGARLRGAMDGPPPDILLLAVYHDTAPGSALERSLALRKGMLVVAHLFALPDARNANNFVLAHELLHTVGATDKYDPATNLPGFPDGYADPDAQPRFPQSQIEIMGGRRPTGPLDAEPPEGLDRAVVGSTTAREIGWLRP
jgi:hypothetical protein